MSTLRSQLIGSVLDTLCSLSEVHPVTFASASRCHIVVFSLLVMLTLQHEPVNRNRGSYSGAKKYNGSADDYAPTAAENDKGTDQHTCFVGEMLKLKNPASDSSSRPVSEMVTVTSSHAATICVTALPPPPPVFTDEPESMLGIVTQCILVLWLQTHHRYQIPVPFLRGGILLPLELPLL